MELSEHTQGAASQSLNWGVFKASVYARMLADDRKFAFQPGEFDTLKLDVKFEGIRPYLHLRDISEQIDLGDHALPYTVGGARAEQHGPDAFGEVVFSRYGAGDARLTRRIVLTGGRLPHHPATNGPPEHHSPSGAPDNFGSSTR